MSAALPDAARRALDDAVARAVVPGGALASVDAAGVIDVHVAGRTRLGGGPVAPTTRYDLASLTKVIATLPSVLAVVSDGALTLDTRLVERFPNAGWFASPSLGDVSVRALLTHTAGLPAWTPLFAQVSTRSTALAAVLQSPCDGRGEVRYSDLGFMLLGALVERVAGERLDAFARRRVFERVGMQRTSFGPIDGDVAATEDCGWRGRLLVGEVHDENAVVWEGVAGHAGLFADVADVARYAAAWLRRDPVLAVPALLDEALRTHARDVDGVARGLGWMTSHPGAFAGAHARGAGHTGFTGTSLWLDPERGVASVLLTNRVHPTRQHGAGIVDLRRAVHGAVHASTA